MQKWALSKAGQHIELGIAENNLFLLLAALGLSEPVFGTRLFPIGTVYDPFIARGLDSLNYACYQDARFLLVGTPSGITLAPEGGAHQSISTPLIGLGQPGLTSFEPAYADEVSEIMRWGFDHMQKTNGGSVYMRLSTRNITQPERNIDKALSSNILSGAYWLVPPEKDAEIAIIVSGAVTPEAKLAHETLSEDLNGLGLLVVSSVDRLFNNWVDTQKKQRSGQPESLSHIAMLLEPLSSKASLVTVCDGHPASLSWIGSVLGHRPYPLGVTEFGESGDIVDLYSKYGLDSESIIKTVAHACIEKVKQR